MRAVNTQKNKHITSVPRNCWKYSLYNKVGYYRKYTALLQKLSSRAKLAKLVKIGDFYENNPYYFHADRLSRVELFLWSAEVFLLSFDYLLFSGRYHYKVDGILDGTSCYNL